MGNLKELASMIPGIGKQIKDLDIDDDAFKSIEAIIYSMTPAERERPEILNGSRRARIARGSGTDVQEVNKLIKQFDETRKMMHMMTTGGGKRAMMNAARGGGRRNKRRQILNYIDMKLIDGKAVSTQIKKEIAQEVAEIKAAGGKTHTETSATS